MATTSSTRPFASASAGLNRVPWSSTSISPDWRPSIRTIAGHAAAAGQQAERGLGQADHGRRVVDDDPVVAGQGDLEAAAERGAVDRGDDRARERLEPAQVGLDRLDAGEERRRRPSGPACDHQLQVAAGEEGLLGAGHDHAGDARPSRRTAASTAASIESTVELVHRVRAGRRVVEGEGDDAVGVPLVADGGLLVVLLGLGHGSVLRSGGSGV